MKLFCSALPEDGTPIAKDYVYEAAGGKNLVPLLEWSEISPDAKSLAITCYDPDAPTGSGWWHWIVVNLPLSVVNTKDMTHAVETPLLENGAEQIEHDWGFRRYGGPCPPAGTGMHRYIYTVYALDTAKLDIPDDATHARVRFMIMAHTIESASVMGVFSQ